MYSTASRYKPGIIVGVVIVLFILLARTFLDIETPKLPKLKDFQTPTPSSKYAYCIFLAEPNDSIKDKDEDYYFSGTRMLIYQLLHDPETKTTNSIPVVVLVTKQVPQWKRDKMTRDGAIVQETPEITIDWIKPARIRWVHVMDKLNIFLLTQYEKVLLFDTDVVVVQPMDGVFEDPATFLRDNAGNSSEVKEDESTQPAQYIMAGNGGPGPHEGHVTWRNHKLNAGFVIFKPSVEMFEHYMSVAQIEGRFPGGSPEQDLWNYVHRLNGNMPWQQVDPHWTINDPTYEDWENGVASLHQKYWRRPNERLAPILMKSRWKTEGYWNSYEN